MTTNGLRYAMNLPYKALNFSFDKIPMVEHNRVLTLTGISSKDQRQEDHDSTQHPHTIDEAEKLCSLSDILRVGSRGGHS